MAKEMTQGLLNEDKQGLEEEISELLDPFLQDELHQRIGIPMPKIKRIVVAPILARYSPQSQKDKQMEEDILRATTGYLEDNGWRSEKRFSIPTYFLRD